ncbi:hypothetical protein LR48_Vigan66s002900 [Vigna angularis]|uniref:Uncharacterized protein n=1 Tax=Phaseolus angularis TaxID=3914 RepID=A0A0L9T4I4_PHAAN|nr:hypothetical protein LR48_Vigan66s002900 [Vigna angularis]
MSSFATNGAEDSLLSFMTEKTQFNKRQCDESNESTCLIVMEESFLRDNKRQCTEHDKSTFFPIKSLLVDVLVNVVAKLNMSLEESPTMYRDEPKRAYAETLVASKRTLVQRAGVNIYPASRSGHSSWKQKRMLREVDDRPAREERALVQLCKEDVRPKKTREEDAHPARLERTLGQREDARPAEADARPLSVPESFTPGREKWGARAGLGLWFFGGAILLREEHGGREELVGTSPPLPLGLLLLPSSMFVSLRVLHGNGEPDSSCWD